MRDLGEFWRGEMVKSSRVKASRPTPRLPLHGVSILLVEDHADAREAIRQLLEHLGGARVVTAADGGAALLWLDEQETLPEVVLCDLRMPGMDGFEFLEQVRADRRLSEVPVIALTALAGPGDYHRTFEAGFSAHIEKPIRTNVLLSTVQRILVEARRHRALRRRRASSARRRSASRR
jgi:CheY-like chemotaxis protein